MSEDTSNTGQEDRARDRGGRRRRWLSALFIGGALAFGFALGNVHSAPWAHFAGHHHLDPEHVERHVERRVNWILSKVDATPEQRDKIDGIVKAAINDVMAQRKEPWEAKKKLVELLSAETVDRSSIEALRAEHINAADAASKRIAQALADAAEVLKPEQRRQLAERWERWHW